MNDIHTLRFSSKTSKDRVVALLLVCVLAVALFARMLYLVNQSTMAIPARHPDTLLYDEIPRHLLAGEGYTGENYLIVQEGQPTAFYGPVYPLFVTAMYWLFGFSFRYIQVAQILISVLTCYLVFLIGRMLFGRKAGLIAAASFAVYPELAAYPSTILSETLFLFLEIMFVYLLARGLSNDKPSVLIFALTGAVFAIAFLCRQVIAIVPVLLIPFVFMRYRSNGWGWMFKRSAAFLLTALVIVLPWSIRNYIAMGTLSPATTTGGVTFWWGNTVDRKGLELPEALAKVKEANPGLNELQMNALLYKLGFENVKKLGPRGLIELAWSKWRKMWMPYLFNQGRTPLMAYAQYVVIYVLLALGFAGSTMFVKKVPGVLAITVVLFSGIAMHLGTIGNSRYSIPYLPLLMIAAAPVAVKLGRLVKPRPARLPLNEIDSGLTSADRSQS